MRVNALLQIFHKWQLARYRAEHKSILKFTHARRMHFRHRKFATTQITFNFFVRHKPSFLRRVHARPFRARTRLRTEICGFLWRRPVKVTPTVGTTHGPSRTSIRNLRRHLTGSRVSTHVWRTLRTRAKARLLFSLEDTRHIWLVVRAVGSA